MSTDTISVLDRALTVLRQLALRPDGYTLPELAAELGLSRSTVRRFLQTLTGQGFADYDAERQRYTLGMLILGLSTGLSQQNVLAVAVHPALEGLNRRTDETCALWLRVRFSALCLSSLESTQFVRTVSPIGRSLPLHAGAHAKVLLAGLEDAELKEYLRLAELTTFTAATVSSPDQLAADVALIRDEGVAISRGEVSRDAVGLAAPVRGPSGQVIGCLSVTAPAVRVDAARLAELTGHVREAADEATRRVSGRSQR